MDQCLININKLDSELKEINTKRNDLISKSVEKTDTLVNLENEEEGLIKRRKQLEVDRDEIKYKSENIKKWKKDKICMTTLLVLLAEILSIILPFGFGDLNLISALLGNLIFIPAALCFGDIHNYRLAKKYLETHNLDDVLNSINDTESKLTLNREKQKSINKELDDMYLREVALNKLIRIIKEELTNLKNLRANIIEEFINNNLELDNLIDTKYQEYETNKKLTLNEKKN